MSKATPSLSRAAHHHLVIPSWLSNLWNHRLVPTIEGHLLSRLGTRAVFELLSALAHHVLKPLCPLDQQGGGEVMGGGAGMMEVWLCDELGEGLM